jgi:tetratricopeptide (TPR) repeat protein
LIYQPNNTNLQLGYAHNLSWMRNYKEAIRRFDQIYAKTNKSDALEGRAFAKYWSGKYDEAEKEFNELISKEGEQTKYLSTLAKIYIETSRHKKSRAIIEKLQKARYRNTVPLLNEVKSSPGFIEITPWVGYSRINEENEFGFRGAEFAIQPKASVRIWVRYDNSLAQDILSIVQSKTPTYAGFAGTMLRMKSKYNTFFTTLEGGYRNLNDTLTQLSFRAEENLLFPSLTTVKLGAAYAPRSDDITEILVYAGVGFPIVPNFTLQPMYFYSTLSNNNGNDHRGMLKANYKWPRGTDITGGILFGKTQINEKDNLQYKSVYSTFITAAIPAGNKLWVLPLLKYENIDKQELFNFALGFKLRIEK